MRGKANPTARVFESPYATTILPAKDSGRAAKPADAPAHPPAHLAAAAHGHAHAPAPNPVPEAAPAAAPVYAPPAAAPLYSAPAEYPVHYPSAPGFPPQPPYADAAQVANPALLAPAAQAEPPAPVGYPSASYQPVYQPAAYQPATYEPATYQPAAYAPPANPPSGYRPNRFEPQGYAAPGYQAHQPQGYQPPGQAQPFQNFPPPSGRSAGAKVLIGVAIGLVGFVMLGILAAIAIPVFLSQRDKPANRNVVLPAALLDQPRLAQPDADGSVASEVANLQRSVPGMTQAQAAFYGSADQPIFLVVAGKLARRPTPADEKSFFSISPTEGDLTLAPVGSGPFGGSMQCGQETVSGQTFMACESLDSAAAVLVVASNTTPSQLAVLARQIIGTIEVKS